MKCIFVVGPEGTGTTLISKVISKALNDDNWRGRGFNCCDKGFCGPDNPEPTLRPCREVEHLVCHRSLPFDRDNWPPIDEWLKMYDCKFVICTRDIEISEKSRMRRFRKSLEEVKRQSAKANKVIKELLGNHPDYFIWSYETFMYLKEDYLFELYKFLGIDSTCIPTNLNSGNTKYLK